jgi:pyoverdine/dityrosine biosynthesis protein Dit1
MRIRGILFLDQFFSADGKIHRHFSSFSPPKRTVEEKTFGFFKVNRATSGIIWALEFLRAVPLATIVEEGLLN